MGLLNKILKGLGFETDEEEVKEKKPKQKDKQKKQNINAAFNLNEMEDESVDVLPVQNQKEDIQELNQEVQELGIEMVKLNNQTDTQNAVSKIKLGKKILINIESLQGEDITRSLDFLSGATYALNKTMQKIDDKLFIIK